MNTNNNKLFANAQMRKQTNAVALQVVTLRRLPFIILSHQRIRTKPSAWCYDQPGPHE